MDKEEEKTEEDKRKHHSELIKLIVVLTAASMLLLVIYVFWDEFSLFFYKYFWKPILEDSGYNPYNTLAYGLILIAVIFLAPLGLKRVGIKGREVAIGGLPFILVGSFARVLEDMELLESSPFYPLFISPLIYVIIAVPLVASLFLGRALKKVELTMLSFGIAILALLTIPLGLNFPEEANMESLKILVIPVSWLVIAIVLMALMPKVRYFNGLSAMMLFGQLLDGCATIFALSLNYFEKHPLSDLLIGVSESAFGNPYLFLVVKVLVAVILIYLLDRTEMDDDFKNIFKFAVIMLGLASGARDMLRVFLGV